MPTKHRVIFGDSRSMAELPDGSVELIVTSPPYWQLKDYGTATQIGFNDSYEDYINSLNKVWLESARVLRPGCRLCINIGDQFARSVYYGRYKIIPIHSEIIRFCETAGLDFLGSIIWQKVTTTNTTGGASIMGSFPYPRNGIVKLDFEYILLFKKPGGAPAPSDIAKENSRMSTEEWNTFFAGHWYFPGERQLTHSAMFPEELPRRLIKMFSFEGELILDPFLGSGTTALAAKNLGRNSIGYEINPDFKDLIQERVIGKQAEMFRHGDLTFENQSKHIVSESGSTLPYLFSDPVRIERKLDPRKLKFGSKVELGDSTRRIELLSVKKVVSPEMLEIGKGIRVRLLGIRSLRGREDEAMKFLESATNGSKVYLKFDVEKYDRENNLLGFVYLANRTFLNAHLLKRGLVEADPSYPHKYLAKFMAQSIS